MPYGGVGWRVPSREEGGDSGKRAKEGNVSDAAALRGDVRERREIFLAWPDVVWADSKSSISLSHSPKRSCAIALNHILLIDPFAKALCAHLKDRRLVGLLRPIASPPAHGLAPSVLPSSTFPYTKRPQPNIPGIQNPFASSHPLSIHAAPTHGQ
jgi:hypothetical protein